MALIETTKGMLEESLLTKSIINKAQPTGKAVWTEYHYEGELVRRDIVQTPYSDAEKRALAQEGETQ